MIKQRPLHWTDLVSYSALAAIALSFPIATAAVFFFTADRVITSHILSVNFTVCIYIALLIPFLRRQEKIQMKKKSDVAVMSRHHHSPLHDVVIAWVSLSCVIHCTWELGWLLLHKSIRQNAGNPLYYAWTAYIDGGDARYATDPISTLVYCLECISVVNGFVGLLALYLYKTKSERKSLVLFVAFSTYHLASCAIYFLSEIVEGCPNVNLDSWFDTWVKFFLVNSPWLVFPWFVLKWVVNEV